MRPGRYFIPGFGLVAKVTSADAARTLADAVGRARVLLAAAEGGGRLRDGAGTVVARYVPAPPDVQAALRARLEALERRATGAS
jgi:hypothetical protein